MNNLLQILKDLFNEDIFLISLSNNKDKHASLSKIIIRLIEIKNKKVFQASSYYQKNVDHKNFDENDIITFVEQQFLSHFKQALIQTKKSDTQLLLSKNEKLSVIKKNPTKTSNVLLHDRIKNYKLKEGIPIDFLVALKVMSPEGNINANKQDKFRQINQFLKIIDESIEPLKDRQKLFILDFGCGSAYLTFALYYYLKEILKKDVEIVGIDLKEDVIKNCSELAIKLGYEKLHFFVGDINNYFVDKKIDVVVTLHACDIATDAALEKAVKWNADLILSVPCCQHELFKQVKNHQLNPLLEQGILKEKFCSLATDAARAKILEILGYKVQVIEFIDMEHTPKNILIRATLKKENPDIEHLKKEYLDFKNLLGITPSLETRFLKEIYKKIH